MLSKSRGQVLHVAATLHALFHIETPQQLPTNVSKDAIVAAVNFVAVCNQHVAFLSGMGDIDTYISSLQEMNKMKILGGQLNCSVKLADVTTRCSSHPQGESEARCEKPVFL